MYSPAQFGKMIGKSVKTLQRWDTTGVLIAKRNPKNRRYYTHEQYLEYIGLKAQRDKSSIVVYSRVSLLVVAHKDRLVRFGFESFEAFAERHGCEVVIMNQESLSPAEEVTQDLLAIIHCFSSRLYGLRKYKDKVKKLVETKEYK